MPKNQSSESLGLISRAQVARLRTPLVACPTTPLPNSHSYTPFPSPSQARHDAQIRITELRLSAEKTTPQHHFSLSSLRVPERRVPQVVPALTQPRGTQRQRDHGPPLPPPMPKNPTSNPRGRTRRPVAKPNGLCHWLTHRDPSKRLADTQSHSPPPDEQNCVLRITRSLFRTEIVPMESPVQPVGLCPLPAP